MKKILFLLPLLSSGIASRAQVLDRPTDLLMKAHELRSVQSHIGVTSIMASKHIDLWKCPFFDEEASYLNAIALTALRSPEAEHKLLKFVDDHPHSPYLPYAQMRLGEWYFSQGNYRSAAYWFRQYDPFTLPDEMAEASDYYHAFSLMRDGREEQALSKFKPLIETPTFGKDATFYSGYILSKLGKVDEATYYLQRLERDRDYGPHACAYIASGLLSKGQYVAALETVRQGERFSPHNTDIKRSLLRSGGMAASSLGQKELAIKYLQAYVQETDNPERLETITLAKDLFDTGKYSSALQYLKRVSRDSQRDFMGQLARYYEGLSHLALGQPKDAVQAFTQAADMSVYPRLTEASKFNAALALYSSAPGTVNSGTNALVDYLVKYPQGEYATQATDHLKDAYLNEPDVEKALHSIERLSPLPQPLRKVVEKVRLRSANTHLDKGNVASAGEQYESIIKNNEDPASVAEAYLWKGEVAYREGKYQDVIQLTHNYLKTKPQDLPINPSAYYNLGYAYYNLSRWNEAAESFQDFLRVHPTPSADEHTAIYNRLADIELLRRNYTKAQSLYDKAIERGGQESDYAYFKKGMTYGYLKDYKTKADHLALLSSKYSTSSHIPEALFEQGRALSLLNEEKSAQNVFQRVFEQYANTEIAPKAGVQLALSYFNMHKLHEAARIYELVARKYPKSEEARVAMEDLKSISIDLNRVDHYTALAKEIGLGHSVSSSEMDSLTYLAAEKIVSEGSPAKAIEAMDRYISSYPQGVFVQKALYSKALVQYQSKAYTDAATTIQRLLQEHPRRTAELDRDAYKLLTSAYIDAGRKDKAAEAFLTQALHTQNLNDRSALISKASENALASSSHDFVLSLADDIAKDQIKVTPQVKAQIYGEALHLLAQSNQKTEALIFADRILALADHGQHSRATVIKALDLYDKGRTMDARRMVQKMIDKGTTDTYWLARGFILLSDTYAKEGDKATAKTYLEGVKSNYSNKTDGIIKIINERLRKL